MSKSHLAYINVLVEEHYILTVIVNTPQVGFFHRGQQEELKKLLKEKQQTEAAICENLYILEDDENYEQPFVDHVYEEPKFPSGDSRFRGQGHGISSVSSVPSPGACADDHYLLPVSPKQP